MRAWIVSDLHLEFGKPFESPVPPDADVMICPGDVDVKGIVPSLEWLAENVAHRVPVVFVAGNHEFYHAALVPSIAQARAFSGSVPNLHFLENDSVEIEGIAFIGATLWTDFRLGDCDPEIVMFGAEHGVSGQRMTDYRRIKYTKTPYRRFKPIHAFRKHSESVRYIASELRERGGQKTVVVSHHAPSGRSIALKNWSDPFSGCYASDLEDLIVENEPALWVHGHVHQRVEYHVGTTKVLANPRGYPGERSGFDPGLTVDI